jgi:hypothetical protein
LSINPWLIVGMAADYQQKVLRFERVGDMEMAARYDYMLQALEELAGIYLHDDPTYFLWGQGNVEYETEYYATA